MTRFNRDFALIRSDGRVLAESHDAVRLESLRAELFEEGIVASVLSSDLPRSKAS
ncbi:hypothetical protein ACWX0K_15090 [Nitrobacteraceae bacterium UC4446_H13]